LISFLFWNIAKNTNIFPHIACLGRHRSIDVFLLAESPDDVNPAIIELNNLRRGKYREASKAKTKVRMLTRLQPPSPDHVFTTLAGETSVWSINPSRIDALEILIAATHLPSKFGGNTELDQALVASDVSAALAKLEDIRNHRRTVLVGDFNMNPYDPGMTHVEGFHGLMTEKLASVADRRYRKGLYRRFYNPMWGFFGDRTTGPAGTHYWWSGAPHSTHWAMFDQVLIRPSLIGALSSLEILAHDGAHSLLESRGYPNKSHLSDHLPILFVLNI
jgi:hypothetical protein